MMKKLFLTGRPRCGKSTLIRRALEFRPIPLGGFAIQRLVSRGETWAFRLLDLNIESYVTHLESDKLWDDIVIHMPSPGKWLGITEVFEGKGVIALQNSIAKNRLLIMDELGIFEGEALRFQELVVSALDGPIPVIGVIKHKSSPFLDSIRTRSHVEIVPVDPAAPQDSACFLENYLKHAGLI